MEDDVRAALEDLGRKVQIVVDDQVEASKRLGALEGERGDLRKDMASRHEFELGLRDDVRSLAKGFTELGVNVTAHLKRQDDAAAATAAQAKLDAELAAKTAKDEADARERLKLEEFRRESMAAKRVTERREYWIKVVAIIAGVVTPVAIAIITTIGIVYQTAANQRAHDDAAAQMREFRRALPAPTETTAPRALP